MNQIISELAQRLEELERRISHMVVRGKIKEVDHQKARAKVEYGEGLTTAWLKWKPIRTGADIIWWSPDLGEGVTVISDGDLTLGEIIPGSYYNDFTPPSADPDVFLIQFGDGSEVSHNRKTGDHSASYTGNAVISVGKDTTVNSKGKVSINSNAKDIQFNGGSGVVTGAHKCAYTGLPHSDCSRVVKAAK